MTWKVLVLAGATVVLSGCGTVTPTTQAAPTAVTYQDCYMARESGIPIPPGNTFKLPGDKVVCRNLPVVQASP